MADQREIRIIEIDERPAATAPEAPRTLSLQLTVTDADSVRELALRSEGREHDEYAICALRIGLLSLKHARGQVDADAVKREGESLLSQLDHALDTYRADLNQNMASALKEYFDPSTGKLPERMERLLKKDGDLEQALRRQIGANGSEMARTLASHLGEGSPLLKLLNPEESDGLLQTLRESLCEVLEAERNRILSEFSLDNKDSALSRLVMELTEERGRLTTDLGSKVEEIASQFSLDKEDSALSRLVKQVEAAQQRITSEFSLDNEESALSRLSHVVERTTEAIDSNLTLDDEKSALSRLRRELVDILKRHEDKASSFQTEVKSALEAMKAKRQEALRSTTHGMDFQALVFEVVQKEAQKSGDIATWTGNTPGTIKYNKKGDVVVELGPDCAAAGEKFVIEAKEDASYDIGAARAEMELGRKNRDAAAGLFIFSQKTAPAGLEPLLRYGEDVFVIWDADDINSDIILKAAFLLTKGLCVRQAKAGDEKAADLQAIDAAILEVEREAKRLANMKSWTETIQSNSGKMLDEIRKMRDGLETQAQALRSSVKGLKESAHGGS